MKTLITINLAALIYLSSVAQTTDIVAIDGFEKDELNMNTWSDYRFLPKAVEIQSDIVHSGKNAVKITLNPGDQMEEEIGTILERAELMEAIKLVSVEDTMYSYSFSLFLPKDFPIDTTRLVIAQWKQYCESGNCAISNPIIALRYESGEFEITLKTNPKKRVLYSRKDEIRNQWLNFRFDIRFSRTSNGELKAWLNDEEVIDYTRITAYSETYGYPDPGYFYFKMGLYRDHMDQPMIIYIDDYRKEKYY